MTEIAQVQELCRTSGLNSLGQQVENLKLPVGENSPKTFEDAARGVFDLSVKAGYTMFIEDGVTSLNNFKKAAMTAPATDDYVKGGTHALQAVVAWINNDQTALKYHLDAGKQSFETILGFYGTLGIATVAGLSFAYSYTGFGFLKAGGKALFKQVGEGLIEGLLKAVFKEEGGDFAARIAVNTVEQELKKGEVELGHALLGRLRQEAVEKVVDDQTERFVSAKVSAILTTLGNSELTQGRLTRVLMSSGLTEREAGILARDLRVENVRYAVSTPWGLKQIKDVLEEELTNAARKRIRETFNSTEFATAFQKTWGERINKLSATEAWKKAAKKAELNETEFLKEAKEKALEGLDEAAIAGAERGIKKGMKKAVIEHSLGDILEGFNQMRRYNPRAPLTLSPAGKLGGRDWFRLLQRSCRLRNLGAPCSEVSTKSRFNFFRNWQSASVNSAVVDESVQEVNFANVGWLAMRA